MKKTTRTYVKKGIKPKDYEEAKKMAREQWEKARLRKERVKAREGYKYFVYTDETPMAHKVYFRNLQSAKNWVNKHHRFGHPIEVYSLDGTLVWEMK